MQDEQDDTKLEVEVVADLIRRYKFDDSDGEDETGNTSQAESKLDQQEQKPVCQPSGNDSDLSGLTISQQQQQQQQRQQSEGPIDGLDFNIADMEDKFLADHQDYTPITDIQPIKTDMWVLVNYKGDIYIGMVMKVFAGVGTVRVKCLERPYGVKGQQSFEHNKSVMYVL